MTVTDERVKSPVPDLSTLRLGEPGALSAIVVSAIVRRSTLNAPAAKPGSRFQSGI